MSVYSSPDSEHSYNSDRLIEILFTKLMSFDGDKAIHDLLKALYRLKPECFVALGGIHNSADGKETYQSVKVWMAKDYFHTIHIYGFLRFSTFKVTHYTLKQKDQTYRIGMERTIMRGGGGGGGGCPW
jgi:hypothetical protein